MLASSTMWVRVSRRTFFRETLTFMLQKRFHRGFPEICTRLGQARYDTRSPRIPPFLGGWCAPERLARAARHDAAIHHPPPRRGRPLPVHVAYKDEKSAMALWMNSIDIRYRVSTEEACGKDYGENYPVQNRRAVGTLQPMRY